RLLPRGARLLHIGQPKTATTSLQLAAATRRDILRQHGVLYPGTTVNHNAAVSALMGRMSPAWGHAPTLATWNSVRAEIDEDPRRRSLTSYGLIVQADDAAAERFSEELGDSLHVVITARSLAGLLPSAWQQYVKSGRVTPYTSWLATVLDQGRQDAAPRFGPGFWAEHDLGAQ